MSFYFMDACFQLNATQFDILHCLLHVSLHVVSASLLSVLFVLVHGSV